MRAGRGGETKANRREEEGEKLDSQVSCAADTLLKTQRTCIHSACSLHASGQLLLHMTDDNLCSHSVCLGVVRDLDAETQVPVPPHISCLDHAATVPVILRCHTTSDWPALLKPIATNNDQAHDNVTGEKAPRSSKA